MSEFTFEWEPSTGEVIAPGAFDGVVGKTVRLTGPDGAQIGTATVTEVVERDAAVRLTLRRDSGDGEA